MLRLIAPLLFALAVAGPSAAVAAAPATPAAESAREMVETSAETVLKTLVQRREEFRHDPAKLEAFMLSELDRTFDHQYSARLVLGRHSRGVAPEQIDAFAKALVANLMRRYGKAMIDFDPNVDVKVLSETPLRDGTLARVATELGRSDGPPVPIDYMVRNVDGHWRVFDVLVEGVSYVQTYRTQFEEQLRNQTLDQVIAGLRDGSLNVGE